MTSIPSRSQVGVSEPMSGGTKLWCSVCSAAARRLRHFQSRDGFAPEHLFLIRCDRCRSEFLYPQPSNEWLSTEYANYSEKRWSASARPKVNYFRGLLASTGIDLSGRRVIDVGASEGDCVAALNALWPSAQVVALEAGAHAKGKYDDLSCDLVASTVEEWANASDDHSADTILMFDLLEHLREPVETLRRIVDRRLRPGGAVVATFPNSDSFSRRLLGRAWPQYKLEHLHYFSRRGVGAMAHETGVSTLRLVPLTKRLPVDYLLSVGTHSGPHVVQAGARAVRAVTPRALDRLTIPARFGEWLWHAAKPLTP